MRDHCLFIHQVHYLLLCVLPTGRLQWSNPIQEHRKTLTHAPVTPFLGAVLLCTLSAQPVAPRFQMPLYFEDAVGNRDTIIVGYDETALLTN